MTVSKHPPPFVWVSYCTRCGDIVSASKRAGGRPFCPFCAGPTTDDNYQTRSGRVEA